MPVLLGDSEDLFPVGLELAWKKQIEIESKMSLASTKKHRLSPAKQLSTALTRSIEILVQFVGDMLGIEVGKEHPKACSVGVWFVLSLCKEYRIFGEILGPVLNLDRDKRVYQYCPVQQIFLFRCRRSTAKNLQSVSFLCRVVRILDCLGQWSSLWVVSKGTIEVSDNSRLALLVGIGIEAKGTDINRFHCPGVEVDRILLNRPKDSMQSKLCSVEFKVLGEVDFSIACVGVKERD